MSITSVKPIQVGRTATKTRDNTVYVEPYRVIITDRLTDTPRDAMLSVPFVIGSQHPEDSSATCSEITPSNIVEFEGSPVYIVMVKFEEKGPDEDKGGGGGSGGSASDVRKTPGIPVLRGNYSTESRDVDIDYKGRAMLNTVGDPIIPTLQDERTTNSFQISARVRKANFDPKIIQLWQDKINVNDFMGHAKLTIKQSGIGYSTVVDNKVVMWDISMNFKIRPHWITTAINTGLYEATVKNFVPDETFDTESEPQIPGGLFPASTEIDITTRVRILDALGEPVGDPVLIDKDGVQTTKALVLKWLTYKKTDLNLLIGGVFGIRTLAGFFLLEK